ncbi:DUF3600 domain-containing protein [Brevibacillus ginsengisoli]|uniref:DUF3600 domain-containing protein n=1 Tax=Brevibacillus ginsengisoli TaxID=363854 RepID=UPI003CFA8CE0
MSIEDQIRAAFKEQAHQIKIPQELDDEVRESYRKFEFGDTRKERFVMKKKWLAGMVAAVLLIPTGVWAGSYLSNQIYGSKEIVFQHGGTQADFDHMESKLQLAKSQLSEEEYAQFSAKLKELTQYQLKMTDEKGITHPDRLTAAEQKQQEQIVKELEPYFAKLKDPKVITDDQLVTYSIEEAQKLVAFPIRYPSYLPSGYSLNQAAGVNWKDMKGRAHPPTINLSYKHAEDQLFIIEEQVEENKASDMMAQEYEQVTPYQLEGYQAHFGEKGTHGRKGVQLFVPKSGKQEAYQIYVSSEKLEKSELEKIVLSILHGDK